MRTEKDKIFDELIKEFKPFLRKSKRLDFGSSSLKKGNHVLTTDYKGYEVIIELK